MGHLEDEENRDDNNSRKNNLNIDSSDFATQKIDSQFSPGGVLEDDRADDFLYLTSTMPVDDNYLLEDAFETQLVNLEGETQVVDLAGETQVLDDLDCLKNMPIEFLNEFNAEVGAVTECEGVNETQVLYETQKLSPDDWVKTDGGGSVGTESTININPPKQGSVCRGFTSIRAASIRASGLAARARRANGNLCTSGSEKSSIEQQTNVQDGSSPVGYLLNSDRKHDQKCLHNEYNEDIEGLRNSNKCKLGGTTIRKLFKEDNVGEVGQSEVGQSEADINHTDDNLDMPELVASGNCLAGLSYANSQEPGDLSQAHALEVVDKFLDLNVMEYGDDFRMRIHNNEKPKVVSATKGSRDLAKSSILKSTDGACGIYDWDDTREDDGGGDFFLNKKELFFDKGGRKRRCLTEPRKPRNPDLESVEGNGDEKEQKYTQNKSANSIYSDSGLMLRKLRAKEKSLCCGKEVFHKNLMKDLDESGLKLAENDVNDVTDMKDIGPDTQMAAEAMETLCFEVHLADSNVNVPNNGSHITKKATGKNEMSNKSARSAEFLTLERPDPSSVGVVTRQAKKLKGTSISTANEPYLSPKQSKKLRKRHDAVLGEADHGSSANVNVFAYHGTESTGQRSEKKHHLEDQLDFSVPVAHRTRKHKELNQPKVVANRSDAREAINDLISVRVRRKRTAAKDKNVELVTVEKVKKVESTGRKPSNRTRVGTSRASTIDAVDDVPGKRSRQEPLLVGHEAEIQYSGRLTRSRKIDASISLGSGRNRLNHSSTGSVPALSSLDLQSGKVLLNQTVKKGSSKNDAYCDPDNVSGSRTNAAGTCTSKQHDKKSDADTSTEGAETNGGAEASPRERCGTSILTCDTPATCTTPIKSVSPICMGDEYHKQSCRKNLSRLSLTKEINNLVTSSPGSSDGMKGSRKRKDITNIRVLFSQHLDVDVIKQQKKILDRLGGAVASFMSDATHFVADEFVRTRNMLEAIACGKPVVTHLWLESCGQASCLIDEKNYILRDARKEKEFGFCLPVSLSRACQHPLLQGQKVLVTPNTKPGKDILANLVKAVHGLAVERLGRSVFKDEKLPDDLLILSCEEDYDTCVPFLEKGGVVYSSELLLNGIVKQKLDYERHRLFADHVKRTRSTIWVKNKNRYLPVTKCK